MSEAGPARVLHVDDDPAYGRLFVSRVEAAGDLSVTTVTSAAEALERLAGAEFHCLVTDYRLSEVDGLELFERVREQDPELPVVVLTGRGSEALASEAVSAGVTDYFRKDGATDQFELIANRVETVAGRYRAERALERERRRNEEFVRLVAHDLRNPMAVVTGWLDILYEDGDETAYRKAREALDRMDDILDNLETLARQEGECAEGEAVELSAVATAAWEVIDPEDAELRATYGLELDADASMLQQALENLVANAVEHGSTSPRSQAPEDAVEHGAPGVVVRVGPTEDGEGFYVADDGAGIPPDEREQVFESGYSGADGSGLGLAIVRRIAEAHGWSVEATESRSGGARIEFRGVDVEADPSEQVEAR